MIAIIAKKNALYENFSGKISTVYKKFIKNFAKTLDKGGEKGYINRAG